MKRQKYAIFVGKSLKINMLMIKKYYKLRDHYHYTDEYRGPAHSIWNLKYIILREITIIFQNRSNFDYHFIINGLAEEFDGHFVCLGENTEICITFSVLIEKEVKRIGENEDEIKKYHIFQITIYW